MIARLVALLMVIALPVQAEQLRLAVTTSFENSGLAEVLVPQIAEDAGLDVQLLVVGTGQALRLGVAGDVDAVLVHSRAGEDAFVADGHGTHRREIMFNDFIVVGPADDPAGVRDTDTVVAAFDTIARNGGLFASRGDDSGTHQREMSIWAQIIAGQPEGPAYRALGAGMGATLNTAAAMGAYTLADRGSWLNFGNKDGMAVVFEGDPELRNQYAYLPVNPAQHAHVNHEGALRLETWLTSEMGQAMIGAYRINGETLFTPNAEPTR